MCATVDGHAPIRSIRKKQPKWNEVDNSLGVAVDRRSVLGKYEIVLGLPRFAQHSCVIINCVTHHCMQQSDGPHGLCWSRTPRTLGTQPHRRSDCDPVCSSSQPSLLHSHEMHRWALTESGDHLYRAGKKVLEVLLFQAAEGNFVVPSDFIAPGEKLPSSFASFFDEALGNIPVTKFARTTPMSLAYLCRGLCSSVPPRKLPRSSCLTVETRSTRLLSSLSTFFVISS